MIGEQFRLECPACVGTGTIQANGYDCTRCDTTGWLLVKVIGMGRGRDADRPRTAQTYPKPRTWGDDA